MVSFHASHTYDPSQPGGYPQQGGMQPGYGYPYGGGPNPTEKNWMGGWALGLGIASWVCCGIFTAVPGIVFGILGIRAANEGQATNKGLSIAGLVLSSINVVALIVLAATGMLGEILESYS